MNIHPISKALFLLKDSKKIWDCIIFTSSKRLFFVAETILKSAVKKGIISLTAMDEFMSKVKTVTHDLTHDAGIKIKLEGEIGKTSWTIMAI